MNLIAVLEQLACQPGRADLDMLTAGLDAPTAAALRAQDPAALRRAFGDTRAMWCYVSAPDDKPERESPDDTPDKAPDEGPDHDPPPEQRPD